MRIEVARSRLLIAVAVRWNASDPHGTEVTAVLMQDELGRRSLAVCDEGDLRGHSLIEELPVALGKHFELRLPGQLNEQPIALARHGEHRIWSALIKPGKSVVETGVDCNGAARPLLIGTPAIEFARSRLGCPGPCLVDAPRRELPPALVQDQRCRGLLSLDDEGELLRWDELVEILPLACGQQPPLGSAGD